tara:strand:- start:146395 stop:147321 length:927 start_codon:yes stop_codon:yes gene_type:complete
MKSVNELTMRLDGRLGLGLTLAASLLGLSLLSASSQAQEACLNDVADFNNAVCTANDVRISRINVLGGPTECSEGQMVTINTLQAELLGGAKKRYDIGMYLGTDGGDAKTSVSGMKDGCRRDFLPLDEGFDDLDYDQCGDISQGVLETRQLADLTLECQDTDGDGFLDIGTCLSWDNNSKDVCTGIEDVVPGTPSKCRCEPVRVGDITVTPKGTIIVEKQIDDNNPSDDTFAFTGDASGSIGDDEEIIVNGLDAGMYTSTEEDSPFYGLTDISCDDDDSFGDTNTRTATFYVSEGETVRCTFTNSPAR